MRRVRIPLTFTSCSLVCMDMNKLIPWSDVYAEFSGVIEGYRGVDMLLSSCYKDGDGGSYDSWLLPPPFDSPSFVYIVKFRWGEYRSRCSGEICYQNEFEIEGSDCVSLLDVFKDRIRVLSERKEIERKYNS